MRISASTVRTVLSPGTHVRVHRRLAGVGPPYWHHGICVDGAEIIEFGGGDLWHKGETRIRRVTLRCFANGAEVEPVRHPITWMGLTYSHALPPDQVVDRAVWLLHHQPPRYQLGHRNCESIAIWCATGDFESFQVKRFLRWAPLVTLALMALSRRRPGARIAVVISGIVVPSLTAVPYIYSRALFDHTRLYPGIGNWTRKS
jgi:hypothetical protein